MIRAVYAFLGKLAYWLASPMLFLISLQTRPRTRVLVVNNESRILLVKNWFGRQKWVLPGGGVRRHEPPAKGAVREIREELSLDLAEDALVLVGTFKRYDGLLPFDVVMYVAEVGAKTTVHPHPLEIIDAKWVHPDELPEPLHPSVKRSLKLWRP